jgi:hypothetical protein
MAIIAVQPDHQLLTSGRYQSFSERWIGRIPAMGHQVRVVDLVRSDPLEQLAGSNALMWWFAHLPFPRNFAKRLMAALNHGRSLPTFPDFRTCWHFDDKVAEYYLLRAAGLPMPRTWIFWRQEDAREFCRSARFPLVLKLAGGITSTNVLLLSSPKDAERWIRRLFGPGATSLQQPSFRHPRSLVAGLASSMNMVPSGGSRGDVQRGYFLVQEFLEGNDYDTRAVAIGNRAYAYRRFNRPADFRASGSGLRDPDRTKIDLDMVRLAFVVARALGTQSIGVDGIYRGSERVLTEVSYYYEGWILFEECQGHWVLHGSPESGELEWKNEQLRPEDAILDDFVAALSAENTGSRPLSGLPISSTPENGHSAP